MRAHVSVMLERTFEAYERNGWECHRPTGALWATIRVSDPVTLRFEIHTLRLR